MNDELADLERLRALAGTADGVCIYFSTPACGVCQALKPKLTELLAASFPALQWVEVDCTRQPLVAGQFQVFAVPTLVVFIAGSEVLRRARGIHPGELRQSLARPYASFFGTD